MKRRLFGLFITHTSTENGCVATLTLRSVRGYERDFENLRRRFMKMDVAHAAEDVFERVMNLAGCTPGDYSSKPNLDLNHEASGREATCEILKCLHDVMRQNEAGIRADWDTEFLHDFRVANSAHAVGAESNQRRFARRCCGAF